MQRNPFMLAPQFPQIQPQQPVRPLPQMPMPQQQQDSGQNMMMSGMGLLGMMAPQRGLLAGLFNPRQTPGLGDYALPAASYNGMGMMGPGGLLGGGV